MVQSLSTSSKIPSSTHTVAGIWSPYTQLRSAQCVDGYCVAVLTCKIPWSEKKLSCSGQLHTVQIVAVWGNWISAKVWGGGDLSVCGRQPVQCQEWLEAWLQQIPALPLIRKFSNVVAALIYFFLGFFPLFAPGIPASNTLPVLECLHVGWRSDKGHPWTAALSICGEGSIRWTWLAI